MENGAPLLDGITQRVTLSHTSHFLVVASLPKTPDMDLTEVNPRTAVGIDTEKEDRRQVLKIRDKFLNDEELKLLLAIDDPEKADASDILAYILAWTCKEALYKAALGSASDWKGDYRIISLPAIASDIKKATPERYGKGVVSDPELGRIEMLLSSWMKEGHVVTLAFSPKIARYSWQ